MDDPHDDDDDSRAGANIAVLVAVVVIVGLAILLLHYLSGNLQTELCLEERRHGCDSSDQ